MSDIALPAPGDQNLDPDPIVLLEQADLSPKTSSPPSSKNPGRPRPHHNNPTLHETSLPAGDVALGGKASPANRQRPVILNTGEGSLSAAKNAGL